LKLKFKHQRFQEQAAKVVVDCFVGQPFGDIRYTIDRGVVKDEPQQTQLGIVAEGANVSMTAPSADLDLVGFRNKEIILSDRQVLANIRAVQQQNGLFQSERLDGKYNLTIEMETGTGKTYTYIKTIYELNKHYGWSKFIIVVPSIAIREGVYKSFEITKDHFFQEYQKTLHFFVYSSKQLTEIEHFASEGTIQVMIINSQAFNSRDAASRRIHMELDEFQSRRPIDVIAKTNPILIIDEPQSVEGDRTVAALRDFQPLFTLRYSATHKKEYNKVFRLDAIDAYNRKLVKKIHAKGFTVKGSSTTDGFLYLETIGISSKQPPYAYIEFQYKTASGVRSKKRKFHVNDDLFELSGQLAQYRGYKIADIHGYHQTVTFLNGKQLKAGEVQGDTSELYLRRVQIRETIKSHLEKESQLYYDGVKVLSLFFIDEVAKYRQYDEAGEELNGEYAQIFLEEYEALVQDYLSLLEDDIYSRYLQTIRVADTHKGYFSIDKRSKRIVNSSTGRGATESDDVDAYDLIMKDKERLLSFSEPTRFIFSHSALKEGWDNPNVFQICTLKMSDSTVKKRQEVGRGLRLCVNQQGERMDADRLGTDKVHDINLLTVIASESYEEFARTLQGEIAEGLSDRPQKVDVAFFKDKYLEDGRGQTLKIDAELAENLRFDFIQNGYIDRQGVLTQTYFDAVETQTLKVAEEVAPYAGSLVKLLESVYIEGRASLVEDGRKFDLQPMKPNQNFYKKEFQELWGRINRKTYYTVSFESDELVRKAASALDRYLEVPVIRIEVVEGEIKEIKSREQLQAGGADQRLDTRNERIGSGSGSSLRYDLIGKLVDETGLTRLTIVRILQAILEQTRMQFAVNPEEFIIRAGKLINEQKATTVIERITYDLLNETYDSDVFTKNNLGVKSSDNSIAVDKHIFDVVVTDSEIERKFASNLDISGEVCVYAKLPASFYIPTPLGKYNPDWAIAFNEGNMKYVYFIAETKGTMSSLGLREVEDAKIECARKHFARLSGEGIKYDVVTTYEDLIGKVMR
jgi:type III restriction enzyme